MELNLAGKRILVTGGSGGIGSEICRILSKEGAEVIIHYGKSKSIAESVQKEITDAGGKATILGHNLSDTGSIADLKNKILETGKIDGLVNCAGIYGDADIDELTEKEWREVLDTNLTAPIFVIRHLKDIINDGGSIVNISSVMGFKPVKFGISYQASKSAMIHLTRSLAVSLAPKLRVNCVAPGYIMTEMNREGWENDHFRSKIESITPMKRWGRPEDIASVTAFLMSDASSFTTGSTFIVDGGIGI